MFKKALVLFTLFGTFSLSAAEYYTPKEGTPTRLKIINSVRPYVELKAQSQVLFVVQSMVVKGEHSVVLLEPIKKDGQPFNGVKSVYGLLKKEDGEWGVVDVNFNEVLVLDRWMKEYKNVPNELFYVVAMQSNVEPIVE